MKKVFVYLLCLIFSVVLLVSGAVAGVIYWAYTGPRDLSAYTTDIEASINEAMKGNKVKIGSAKLAYGGLEKPIYIDVANVSITSNKGIPVANLKEMQLSYGLMKLTTGNFVPSKLSLIGFDIDTRDFFESKQESSLDLKDFDLSELKEIELKQGKVKIFKLDEEWFIRELKLNFRGNDVRMSGAIFPYRGNAIVKEEQVLLSSIGQYNKGNYEVGADVQNLSSKRFSVFVPEIEGIDITFDGKIRAKFTKNKLESVSADISKIAGDVVNPKLRNKLSVAAGKISGSYNLINKAAVLNNSEVLFTDNVKISGAGGISPEGDIKGDFAIANMPIEILQHYWPVDVGNNAIAWINAHLKKGIIPKAVAKINIKGTDAKAGKIPETAVDLNFDITGMDVNYVDDLLPVKNANGNAHMDVNSLHINVLSGSVGTSAISNTKVNITEIGTGIQEQLDVEGDINGNIRDIADFYLKVNKRQNKETLFSSTSDVNGNAKTHLIVKLPLKDGLKVEQVSVDVNSQISGGTAKTEKLSAGNVNINLKVNDKGYAVAGNMLATIGGNDKDYNFADVPLKVDFSKYGTTKIALDADITNSEISIKQLGAKKAKAEKGRAELMVSGNTISKLVLDSKSIKIIGSGTLNAAMDDISTLSISSLEAGGSKLTAEVKKEDGYKINFNADVLNAIPIIDSVDTDEPEKSPTKISLDGKVAKMLFHQDQALDNVTLKISCAAECNNVSVDSKELKIEQSPEKLLITSDNAGKMLKMLDAYDNMDGGTLKVNGKGIGKNGYDGRVVIEDFTIQKAEVLTKILTLGSLTGIADALQGKGINFKRLRTKFTRTDASLEIKDFKMWGASIGVTTDGKLNRKTNEVDFQGKIIPAYTANTLLGKIPLLGDIIIGDEGVFAFAYSVSGKLEDPKVFVNPLSVLAPGFLQEIFQQ